MAKPTVIVIAGGANSRFFPFQSHGPKGAFTLLGKPLLTRTIENLVQHDYRQVIFVITARDAEHGITQGIVERSGLHLDAKYVIQAEPKGMGDATLLGAAQLAEDERQRFAVISAYQLTAGELLDQMAALGNGTVVAAATTDRPQDYGMLSFTADGLVEAIIEKPEPAAAPSDQKALTIYLLDGAYLRELQNTPPAEYSFETALAATLKRAPAPTLRVPIEPLSLKYPWHVLRFLNHLLGQQQSGQATSAQIAPTAVIDESVGPVVIGEHAKIGHASRIVGPCYIGENVVIGDFVLVRSSAIEKAVHLGCFTEVARSVIGEGTHFHSGYVGDSIIGQQVRIGAGFINANKRLDRRSIGVKIKGSVVDSGTNQLGALIGDHAHIGVHVSVMPGKCIAPHAVVMPHQSVTENVLASE